MLWIDCNLHMNMPLARALNGIRCISLLMQHKRPSGLIDRAVAGCSKCAHVNSP